MRPDSEKQTAGEERLDLEQGYHVQYTCWFLRVIVQLGQVGGGQLARRPCLGVCLFWDEQTAYPLGVRCVWCLTCRRCNGTVDNASPELRNNNSMWLVAG